LSNFPPACSSVSTTSTADFLCSGISSTGIPLPSSSTIIELSASIVIVMFLQCPAIASSMELSTTSYTKWCRPSFPVPPMYIPGLFLTASNPSRTCIFDASYLSIFRRFFYILIEEFWFK